MDCYIEVSWILMVFVSFGAYTFAIALTSKKYALKKALIILLIGNGFVLFYYQSLFMVLVIELVQDLWVCRGNIKTFFEMELTRFFLLFALARSLEGTLVNTVLFIPTNKSCFYALCILFLFVILSIFVFAPLILHEKYLKEVTITLQKQSIQIKGYVDSGNFLNYQNKPVIFLNNKYQKMVSGMQGVMIDYTTVAGSGECMAYLGTIEIDNQLYEVYVSFLCFDEDFDCLLNSQLLKHV